MASKNPANAVLSMALLMARRATDDAMAQVQQAARQANGASQPTARDEGN